MITRVPLVSNLKIKAFSGATITDYDSGMTNALAVKKGDKLVAQQRPGIDIFEDASTQTANTRGRAIFYWDANTALYIVNNNKIYKGSQSNIIGTITAGTKKCKFVPVGSYLVLIDPANSQAWTITTGDVVTQITDVDFPATLAFGGSTLNSSLYVMDTDGVIYGSALNDPTSWSALNYTTAERQPDGGSYLGHHHDHLVAYGPRTIEFFYDAANATGSPLNRRQDIAYLMGCNNGESIWEDGDRSFFIGTNASGGLGVYSIEQFNVKKISEDELDSFITQAIVKNGYSVVGSGFSADGRLIYVLTFYLTVTDINPSTSLAYDSVSGLWLFIKTSLDGRTTLPLIDWSIRDGVLPRYGEGILSNGDLITLNDNLIPNDTNLGGDYFVSGYIASGYYASATASSVGIDVVLRTGQNDFGSGEWKFAGNLKLIGDLTANSQTVSISYADGNNATFSTARSIDASTNRILSRLGRFKRRNHQVTHSSTDLLQLESLEVEL